MLIGSCFQRLSLLLCAEGYENKKLLPKQRVCDTVQLHSTFAQCEKCIRASSPLRTTARPPGSIQVQHLDRIWYDQRTLSRQLERIAWFKEFPVKIYIGETGRPKQERMKEHERDIRLAITQTSAVSEHAKKTGHRPLLNEDKFID